MTPSKKRTAKWLSDLGWHPKKIAAEFGVHRTTVTHTLDVMEEHPDPYWKKPRPGRPRKMDERDVRQAARAITSNFASDATDVQRKLFPHVSPVVVRQRLSEAGLPGRRRRKKPLLSKKAVQKRRVWEKRHRLREMKVWKRTIFSDESKFNLVGSDGLVWCRRRTGEALKPQYVKKKVAHGEGHIMVWGCITWNGVGRLHRIKGTLRKEQYCEIMKESFLGTLDDHSLSRHDIIFQQDNDPKHTSKLGTQWFRENHITVLDWPSSSPDMNIIEHVWAILDAKVRSRPTQPTNKDQLWRILQEEWQNLDIGYIRNLYLSIPRRFEALRDAKGMYTKY
ncbi:transposase [Phanerochaete sordida]|uniref:Transposase n=1 Tax=Phanerochaete sordida TaxID=48140 RepID=A0A9P3GSS0_9APHY|nr:transposase [Phanerochaete sordida]